MGIYLMLGKNHVPALSQFISGREVDIEQELTDAIEVEDKQKAINLGIGMSSVAADRELLQGTEAVIQR